MPVVLISETERFKWTDEETETTLFFRRPSSAKQRELQAACTERGQVHQGEYLEDLIAWSVLDWEGPFVDDKGEPIKFETGMTQGLPDTYKARFILNLYTIDPIKDQMGN